MVSNHLPTPDVFQPCIVRWNRYISTVIQSTVNTGSMTACASTHPLTATQSIFLVWFLIITLQRCQVNSWNAVFMLLSNWPGMCTSMYLIDRVPCRMNWHWVVANFELDSTFLQMMLHFVASALAPPLSRRSCPPFKWIRGGAMFFHVILLSFWTLSKAESMVESTLAHWGFAIVDKSSNKTHLIWLSLLTMLSNIWRVLQN